MSDKWLPMSTAPKDGTVIQLCELNYSTGEGYVMPGCWMQMHGDPKFGEEFWGVAPTSRVPAHLAFEFKNPEGKAVGWRAIALTPLCWKPLSSPPSVKSLKARQARKHKKEVEAHEKAYRERKTA